MKVNIVEQSEVKEVGDAYVVNHPTMLYTDNLIVKAENGTYVACGMYDEERNKFELVDVDKPAYFVSNDKEFSYDKLIELMDNDDVEDYAEESEFSID